MLADFAQYYPGLSLVDIWPSNPGSKHTPRTILALIRQLPPGSRTMAMLRGGPQFRGWDMERYFLAGIIDAVRENTYTFIMANTEEKHRNKVPEPQPIETPDRPAQKQQPKRSAFAAMAARQLAIARMKAEKSKGE